MYQEILYEVNDPVATITLNRPASLNAWTSRMDAEVRDAVIRAADDPNVVGIIITGAGRGFSAGADMKLLGDVAATGSAGASTDPWLDPEGDFDGRFTYLLAIDKPIIAAVNGVVAGMSLSLTLCCDLRISTPDAEFYTAFAQRGLIAEWGVSWLLPRLVGPAVALDLLFSARKVAGDEALRLGLVNYVVASDELLTAARSYIENMARSCSPTSLAVMKRQVYEQLHQGLGVAEQTAYQLLLESIRRSDFSEGVNAFVQRRLPNFERIGSVHAVGSRR
jgi:enoyl-CoA hydratase/carnithine racemase